MGFISGLVNVVVVLFSGVMAVAVPLIVAQICLPGWLYPAPLVELKRWYGEVFGDYLVTEKPHFFTGLVWVDIAFVWPLSLANVYGILARRPWVSTTSLMAGVSTATSMLLKPANRFRQSPSIVPVFMSDLNAQIPTAFDPFADANAEDSGAGTKDYVHIRIQQRNGRKSLTTVQGLKKEFSYNKILKDLKKEFCCNGTVVQDPELGQVIQLQGDQRKNVSSFLVQAGIVKKEHIKIHGF
ncbi:hypothetical protein C4D60_Mb04t34810 [Musa balbisiana]|uniref:Protein translation factor SUI1 homolog n=1 Tax=Musa balbisiana TaxID=52838 RepID=A0A4S8KH06_MUSBA|nr:hypothetical protein C4D60_Mb04t34810 [Musa balbisiana]